MDAQTLTEDQLLTAQQVAQRLVVAESTLAVWRCTKYVPLPYVKIGGQVRYRASDVRQFIESNLRPKAA
jgi:predicted DNA-binding transcriptional regulator AlpA